LSLLDRLEARFAEREPALQAFLSEEGRFERVHREMAALEARWPDPEKRPPLFGVPLGVKDVYHVDGFETGAGSRLPPKLFEGPQGTLVTALRKAGALILGKTVSTEFAWFGPGPTRNPWDPERTPGGSSSGSAAAVAANLCPLAIGTQTVGSVLRPAAFCGVVGYKPSRTQIPTDGMVHLAPSLDEVGFFTPDADRARVVGSLLCRQWRPLPPERTPRLAVPEGPYLDRVSEEGRRHFDALCDRLADAGFPVVHVPVMKDFDEIVERHYRIVAAEAARIHEPWFDRYRDLYHPKTVELVLKGRGISDEELARDLDGCEKLQDHLIRYMNQLDLWISPPALGPAPRGLDSTGDPVMNLPWTQSGLPAVSLPAGRSQEGLPMGLQLAGMLGDDDEMLFWATQIEPVLAS